MKYFFLDCHRYSIPRISFVDDLKQHFSTYFTTARRFSCLQDILWKHRFDTIENSERFNAMMKYILESNLFFIVQGVCKIWKLW